MAAFLSCHYYDDCHNEKEGKLKATEVVQGPLPVCQYDDDHHYHKIILERAHTLSSLYFRLYFLPNSLVPIWPTVFTAEIFCSLCS